MFRSLYIHVPFCNRKCDYCAFYSLGSSTAEQHRAYLDRIQADFIEWQPQCEPLESIFIGGGTPTALSPTELGRLLELVRTSFTLKNDCEWTCEATPDSLTNETIEALADGGVNRVSIGIQSFDDAELKAIGRRSSVRDVSEKVRMLRSNGIGNINFDFIYLIPGQTVESFASSLRKGLELCPEHVSAYALTLEERSILAKRIDAVDDTAFEQFWDTADDVLGRAGLERYEISNFAQKGKRCRHNEEIWHGQTYLGCGPAATSFDGETRFTQPPNLAQWLRHEPPERDTLPQRERACEILAFGMRTTDGWNWNRFTERTGFDPMVLRGEQLFTLKKRGLLDVDSTGARPTRLGLLFNDDILSELI